MPNPTTITVSIDIETGNMTVDPTLAYVSANFGVTWHLVSGSSLTISFPNQSPFSQQQLRSDTQDVPVTEISENAQGVYHYSVAAVGPNGKIYTIPGCPEIVVQ
jgi:hypothetical protein